VEREVVPIEDDTPVIAAVKPEEMKGKAGRPRKITGSPWEVEGVSRRTWERRQAKAKSVETSERVKPDARNSSREEEGGSG
jgi:hypothetical protein